MEIQMCDLCGLTLEQHCDAAWTAGDCPFEDVSTRAEVAERKRRLQRQWAELPLTVRAGVPLFGGRLFDGAKDTNAPLLVSASALWDRKNLRFRQGNRMEWMPHRVALDSAGFVAMRVYGGVYPWSVAQYVALAVHHCWDWWSAMDLCCEPEIATDRAAVCGRVAGTADLLRECRDEAARWRDYEGAHWATDPMPILQGWQADDYACSVDATDRVLQGEWPQLVGVGSVCRRHLRGPDGLVRVLERLDSCLPRHVRLHLFGVKSAALSLLGRHPRLASVDSCAWDMDARIRARKARKSCDVNHRLSVLREWINAQESRLCRAPAVQQSLFVGEAIG